MSKNIWIINQTAGTPRHGWGERHYFLSKYWVQKGYQVKIISGSHNHLFRNQPQVSKSWFTLESIEPGIDFCWVKTPYYEDGGFKKFWSNIIYMIKLFFLSSKKIGVPDIILVSSMPIFPIINGYFFKKKYNTQKLIVEIRDLWPLTPIYLKGYSENHLLVKIVGWFEKFAYKKSDEIVSLLPNAEKYITSISKKAQKFHYIPNGIDENLLGNQKLPEEISNKIPKNKFIIGYAGTIGLANAMEYIVSTSKKIKNDNIHFVIVGDGYLKKKFVEEVKSSTNITFIDKIPKSMVQDMLSYFNVCYVSRYKSPLYKHGVSYNKYFDYMLARKPILESSEYIKDQVELSGCGIIVEPESEEALINGIDKIYGYTSQKLDEIGELGYNFVKKYHSFTYLSDKYISIFEE